MSTPHKTLMDERIRNIAIQEVMQHIKGIKVDLSTSTCGDTGVLLSAKATFFGQELSSTSIFITFPKNGDKNV